MKVEKGFCIERNGILIHVHDVKNGEVFFRKWPKGIEKQCLFENLFRMPVDEFEKQIK